MIVEQLSLNYWLLHFLGNLSLGIRLFVCNLVLKQFPRDLMFFYNRRVGVCLSRFDASLDIKQTL